MATAESRDRMEAKRMGSGFELGFSPDIALKELLALYSQSDEFKDDVRMLTAGQDVRKLIEGDLRILHRASLKSVFTLKQEAKFATLTAEWVDAWQKTPQDRRHEVEVVASKWGLKCDWGFGLLASEPNPDEWYWNFVVEPLPNTKTRVVIEADAFEDDRDSIAEKVKLAKHQLLTGLAHVREAATDQGFRGLERHQPPKDLASQVKWLFWHITPPKYMNAREISERVVDPEGQSPDQFYVERCYRQVAKTLGIRVNKGWQKGRSRSRALGPRAYVGEQIAAKTDLKN